jgi:hypothetical protein
MSSSSAVSRVTEGMFLMDSISVNYFVYHWPSKKASIIDVEACCIL